MKKALITGITGQDGSYLAELLLEKGYEVHGIIRRASTFNTQRIDRLYKDPHVNGVKLFLHYGDMKDSSCLARLVHEIRPDEVYNLAAQSHVRVSFDSPEFTGDVDAMGAMRLLEAIRETGLGKSIRYYQASTSELFGKVQEVPQRETTPFYPRSPYAVAKLYAFWAVKNYREAYGMFASNILTLPRTVSFARLRRVLTKAQGGRWGMEFFPEHADLLRRALLEYESGQAQVYTPEELDAFRADMLHEIALGLR